jgi:predicted nucleic acid-binding protein
VETSALLAALLEGDSSALASLRERGRRLTSVLTIAEASRALVRVRNEFRLSSTDEQRLAAELQAFAADCDLVAITEDVLVRCGQPFPVEPVRTLDAIHLSTAQLVAVQPALVTVITRDRRVRDNAMAMGFVVA